MQTIVPVTLLLVVVIGAALLAGVERFTPPTAVALGRRDEPVSLSPKARTIPALDTTTYGIPEKIITDSLLAQNSASTDDTSDSLDGNLLLIGDSSSAADSGGVESMTRSELVSAIGQLDPAFVSQGKNDTELQEKVITESIKMLLEAAGEDATPDKIAGLGYAVVGASLMVSMLSNPSKKRFVSSLSAEQMEVYRGISRKRLMIYIMSIAIGGIAGYMTLFSGKDDTPATSVCKAVGVSGLVTYLCYMLWPKNRWMLQYTTPEQSALWIRYYRDMSYNYHMGYLVFLIGYGIVMHSQCGGKGK